MWMWIKANKVRNVQFGLPYQAEIDVSSVHSIAGIAARTPVQKSCEEKART